MAKERSKAMGGNATNGKQHKGMGKTRRQNKVDQRGVQDSELKTGNNGQESKGKGAIKQETKGNLKKVNKTK